MHSSKIKYEYKVVFIFSCALIIYFTVELIFTTHQERTDHYQMRNAISLAENWFNEIDSMKKQRKITNDVKTNIKYSALIGDEFTDITTTLGSLDAKEISTNPEFAAFIIKYLTDSDIDSSKTVGLILSGSFPALSISCLAAIQSLNAKAVIFSSLGSSMYGANQPGAAWIDIENYLRENGKLKYKSAIITLGGEDDNGGGLSEEGIQTLKTAALNNKIDLYIPRSLRESIEKKVKILLENKINLFINIGGNQTSLGGCIHSLNIPNGLHKKMKICKHDERGIIMHLSEKGIPFINLLNIRALAIENEISINSSVASSSSIYEERETEKIPIGFSILILFALMLSIRKKKKL